MPAKPWNETSAKDYGEPTSDGSRKDLKGLWGTPDHRGPLSEYQLLSPTAGVRVSPLCLGGMSLGTQWEEYMSGKIDVTESEELLDFYYKAGGNFIDLALTYQDEQSEHIVGDWMEKRGNRHDMVIATKYTTYWKNRGSGPYEGIPVNYVGNSKKSLMVSIEQSLRNLKTDYIDLYYIHWWDWSVSIPELMQSLGALVHSGKVLYLGVSDTPAWVVSEANAYARAHALPQFVVYQGLYNLSVRDMERDIIPMCRFNGMSIAPYGVLGQGRFNNPELLKQREHFRGGMNPTEGHIKISEALQEVANEIGKDTKIVNIALAWARQMMSDTIPIIGGTKIDHLKSNIEALNIKLTQEQMDKLDKASPFSHGFPTANFGRDPRLLSGHTPNTPNMMSGGKVVFNGWP